MAEDRDGLNGRVVRGWLSRMTPGPWSGEAVHGRDVVTICGEDDEVVAEVVTDRGHENAGPIEMLPEVLRRYLTLSGELLAVEQALAASGVDEGGTAGISALRDQLASARGEVEQGRRDFDAQGVGWTETIDQLAAAQERLTLVRGLLTEWGGRTLTDEGAGLYRELANVVMASIKGSGAPTAAPDGEADDPPE